jgi:hypothetical protein
MSNIIGTIVSSNYDPASGQITMLLNNSTINGYQNTVYNYQSAQTLSAPLPGLLTHVSSSAISQMQVTGFATSLIDENYTWNAGEHTAFSQNWYTNTRINGCDIQQAQTANIENMVMGQSTNHVLTDIMALLVAVIDYLNTHVHSGVTTGGGVSGVVTVPAPDDSTVVSDQTYIGDNKNLAITGSYEPY